jgi:hypothetical protein
MSSLRKTVTILAAICAAAPSTNFSQGSHGSTSQVLAVVEQSISGQTEICGISFEGVYTDKATAPTDTVGYSGNISIWWPSTKGSSAATSVKLQLLSERQKSRRTTLPFIEVLKGGKRISEFKRYKLAACDADVKGACAIGAWELEASDFVMSLVSGGEVVVVSQLAGSTDIRLEINGQALPAAERRKFAACFERLMHGRKS